MQNKKKRRHSQKQNVPPQREQKREEEKENNENQLKIFVLNSLFLIPFSGFSSILSSIERGPKDF